MSALRGLLRKEVLPHPARPADAGRSSSLLPVVQVVLFGYAIRTDVDHVRLAIVDPAPDYADARAARRFAAARRLRHRGGRAAHRATLEPLFQRGARAGGGGVRARLRRAIWRAALPARLLIVTDATEPNTGSVVQAYAHAVIQAYERELGAARPARSRIVPERADALQPDARELEPVRARA